MKFRDLAEWGWLDVSNGSCGYEVFTSLERITIRC